MTTRAHRIAVIAAATVTCAARAEPPAPDPVVITDAFPLDNVVLPANGFVFFFGDGEGGRLPELFHGGDSVDVEPMSNAFVVDPRALTPAPAAGESFTVLATCSGCDLVRTWTMGDEDDTEPPVVDDTDVEQVSFSKTRDGNSHYVSRLVVPPIRDAQPYLVLLRDSEGARSLFPASRTASTVVDHEFTAAVDATGERCVDVDAIDVSFNTTFIATHCVSLDDAVDVTPSCATTSPSVLSALACFAFIAHRRRAVR